VLAYVAADGRTGPSLYVKGAGQGAERERAGREGRRSGLGACSGVATFGFRFHSPTLGYACQGMGTRVRGRRARAWMSLRELVGGLE
jgi:hypothetical protein